MSTQHGPIVLIGLMGSGKSSVARAIAKQLRCEVVDTDLQIEKQAQQSITAIFRARGEDTFRRLETQVLSDALHNFDRVISTGGGIVKSEANRELLKSAAQNGATIVYLRAAPPTLAQRIRKQSGVRPLIDGERVLNIEETRERVATLLRERSALYKSCATAVVDVDTESPMKIAGRIIEIARIGSHSTSAKDNSARDKS